MRRYIGLRVGLIAFAATGAAILAPGNMPPPAAARTGELAAPAPTFAQPLRIR